MENVNVKMDANVSAAMNNKTIVLLVLAGIFFYHFNTKQENIIPNINPSPPNVVVPTPAPLPFNNEILYDKYDKAIELAEKYNRKIVLVFGADWCPYCRDIKKDTKNNKISNFTKYIVCFIDTDINSSLTSKFRIKGLPTSIIIDKKENELSRKTGYKNQDYNQWLDSSLEEYMSWMYKNY